jgi:hypothetical protein
MRPRSANVSRCLCTSSGRPWRSPSLFPAGTTEHAIFTSTNGETANSPIVSVPKVCEGKVSLWKDYWDLNAIASTTWFQSSLAAGDMSWVFDASGLI